jgi:hypothetical protein
MAEGKYGKYIVTDLFTDFQLPPDREWERAIMGRGEVNGKRRFMEHMLWMDSRVIPGAFYAEAVWFWPQGTRPVVVQPGEESKHQGIPPHSHPFPELLSYYGTDMEHPDELGAQVEFWMEDEKYVFEKSFVVYIPAGVVHCPLHMYNMTRPIFHYTMGPGQNYENI